MYANNSSPYKQSTLNRGQRVTYLDRSLLPHGVESVREYYNAQGLTLSNGGEWVSAICPFHNDTSPNLRINGMNGSFRCMVCGAKGGGTLDFHMMKHCMGFKESARALGAWVEGVRE